MSNEATEIQAATESGGRVEPVVMNAQSLANRVNHLESVNKFLNQQIVASQRRIDELQEDARLLADYTDYRHNESRASDNPVWIWQGDGYDNSKSMHSHTPVLIRAYQLRELLEHGEKIPKHS